VQDRLCVPRGRLRAYGAVVLLTATIAATSGFAEPNLHLIDAIKRHDPRAVQRLLQQGVDVNAPQGDGTTAVHWAVYLDDRSTVDLLIRAAANVNVSNELGVTPLFIASSAGSGPMVATLLAAGAKPNSPSGDNEVTPLMAAARSGSVEAVTSLLSHGADVNAVEEAHGQSALMWALANRHPDVARVLIEGGASVAARSRVLRRRMVVGGDHAMDVDLGGSTALLIAARHGDVESARLLISAGADVNDTAPDGTSVLVFAAHSGHGAFAIYLLDQGADPSAEGSGYSALHAAVLRRDIGLIRALLTRGANPNATLKRGTPMRRASKDFGFYSEWIGATPFWLAARFADVEIMRELIAGQADPRLSLPDGTTPFMAAAGIGTGDPTREDRRNRRRDPTEFAALGGDLESETLEAVKFVAGTGANVNAANAAGDTAVHAAVSSKATSVVLWLANNGAKLDVVNKRGETALSIASKRTRGQDDEGAVDTKMLALLERLVVSP